ncbi:Fe(2+)/alpha-ketoglutarate-dependent dioxygenase LpxO [hydrothermal vent metagenome]|uniref:Fe(2+)/alpha-ketoglutarate-dependent dioxygenase LpxO n=1 Tax=hydrothermal vent metagenome TaxID=652676 RepID=A0A3B0YXX1_9ZZZZ
MTTFAILVAVYILCIVFIRRRNKVTFSLMRQLSDFSTFMVPINIPAYLFSKIPLKHAIDTDYFPELKIIEENWEVIRDEALALYENGHISAKDDLPASSFYKNNRWTSFYLKSYQHNIPSAHDLAPRTMALIDQVPSMRLALFACLNPGKKINNHHDPFAFTLRYSLGLSTPNSDESGIIVNGEDYKWADGESILFDETYLHSAYNASDKPRIILMTDIERPLKLKWLQKTYYLFGNFFNGLFTIDNVDASNTGIGNKLGYYLNKYKAFMKRFKRWNKPVYVSSKVLVLGGLLYLVFF